MAPNIVAFASKKGGAGKTTTALAFASLAAHKGQKTLLVDVDHEGHATDALNCDIRAHGSAALLLEHLGQPDFQKVISPSTEKEVKNLHVLAGNPALHDREIERLDPEALRDKLSELEYDLVVIDCPPSRPEVTKLGVVAARVLFIPVTAARMSINSGDRLLADILLRREKRRPAPERVAFVGTMIDLRRRFDRELPDALKARWPDYPVFQVSQDIALAGASTAQEAIMVYEPEFSAKPQIETLLKFART